MLVDFRETFKDSESQDAIPDGYIDIMNQTAPPNTHYERVEKDRIILKSNDGNMKLGGFYFEPNDYQKEALGDPPISNDIDIMGYLYNSQTIGKFLLINKGKIIVNGEPTSVDKLDRSLTNEFHISDIGVEMHPQPIRGEFCMKIGDGEVEQKLRMVRKANNSISEMLFESYDSEKLQLSMRVDTKDTSKLINYTVRMGNPSTVSEALDNLKLYNAFAVGNVLIDGKRMNPIVDTTELKMVDTSDILFWEKVIQIEEALHVHFKPMDVPLDTVIQVEVLYQSLIRKNPTRYENRIDSLKGTGLHQNLKSSLQESLGKPMMIEFSMLKKYDVLGEQIELPGLMGICNAVLQDYDQDGDTIELKFADESEEKRLYVAVLLFRDEDELNEFMKKTAPKERNRKMIDAKSPVEYI